MSTQPNLEKLFQEWNELNQNAQEALGEFDFAKIKEIRAGQKEAEDAIYEILKENAPENILKILPDDCGEMEIGYEIEEKRFYFVMFDPEYEDEDEEDPKIIAITLDIEKHIDLIKDFKME
ncbi:MAG: hypothetical protein ACW986_19060 [Promethearchaeota archaeon]|jgi:hypothetical protein